MADKFDTLYEALVALGTEGAAKAGYFAEGGDGGGVEAFTVNGKSPVDGNIEVGTVRKVNGVEANAAGEVTVPAVTTVNGTAPDNAGNVNVGTVRTVNGGTPNASGNVDVGTVRSVNGATPDANGNVVSGTVTSVNGTFPDSHGEVNVPVPDITPVTVFSVPEGTAAITIGEAHKDKMNILHTTGEAVITLPPNLGTDAKPYTAMIVNATGNMRIVGGEGVEIISFADVAIAGITLGLLNTGTTWVVVGTSQASITP